MSVADVQHSRELRISATIFYTSLCLSIIGCTVLIWQESRGLAVLTLLGMLAVSTRASLLTRLVSSEKLAGWMLALATLNFFLIVPELTLRVAGFRSEAGIQFGYPRPEEFVGFDPDERLFWKLRTSGRNVNSFGFPGEEVVIPKPAGRYRILFLGDSCTQQGYPDMVEVLLNAGDETTPRRFESVTLAISGYSSHQGRVLADMYGERLEPDLAVVYFGWNDHWQAYQAIDSERAVPKPPSPWARYLGFAQQSRLMQGLGSLLASLTDANEPIGEVRVPRAQYQENLLAIQRLLGSRRVPVLFVTAPTSHYRLGVPDYLVDLKFVRDKESSAAMHRSYNETVREVAAATGSYLLDLERDFDSSDDLGAVFTRDGIHFTQAGLALVAKRVADFLGEVVLVQN
jgi:lysophospholipase L1-like esterase